MFIITPMLYIDSKILFFDIFSCQLFQDGITSCPDDGSTVANTSNGESKTQQTLFTRRDTEDNKHKKAMLILNQKVT